MSANPDTKKGVGMKIVSPQQGHLDKMCRHLAVVATCRRHVDDFLSQANAGVLAKKLTFGATQFHRVRIFKTAGG
jgi:hypothetical protein